MFLHNVFDVFHPIGCVNVVFRLLRKGNQDGGSPPKRRNVSLVTGIGKPVFRIFSSVIVWNLFRMAGKIY